MSSERHNLLGWRGPNYNRVMLWPCAVAQVQIEGMQCLTKEYWKDELRHHESQVVVIAKNAPVVRRN